MSDNAQVIELLMKIHSDVGELKGTMTSMGSGFAKHLEDDRALASTVKNIELTMARQKGAMRVLATFATLVGSVIGASAAHFITKGSH